SVLSSQTDLGHPHCMPAADQRTSALGINHLAAQAGSRGFGGPTGRRTGAPGSAVPHLTDAAPDKRRGGATRLARRARGGGGPCARRPARTWGRARRTAPAGARRVGPPRAWERGGRGERGEREARHVPEERRVRGRWDRAGARVRAEGAARAGAGCARGRGARGGGVRGGAVRAGGWGGTSDRLWGFEGGPDRGTSGSPGSRYLPGVDRKGASTTTVLVLGGRRTGKGVF
ncbi:hypothetical protein HNR40_009906, partial [Nonomuraea endophytica]|nr:hypothetical protein [Nonomuraea endophytica]